MDNRAQLLDNYRRSCCSEGIRPRNWLEQAFLKIPKNVKSVCLCLKSPSNEDQLTETEFSLLFRILLQKPNLITPSKPTSHFVLKTGLRQEGTFAIPQTLPAKKSSFSSLRSLPIEALELHGSGVNGVVIQELAYHSLHLSVDCKLASLVIQGAQFESYGSDVVCWLAMCGPLRRSLKKFVLKDCVDLRVDDASSWALFFGTTPLESLSFHNTGLSCEDLSFLCQILCDNEVPRTHLRRLELTVRPKMNSQTVYTDSNFLQILRCLSSLLNLEDLKLDCLQNEQKLQIYEEWKALKGENRSFFQSEGSTQSLHVSVDLNSAEESMTEIISFSQYSTFNAEDRVGEDPGLKSFSVSCDSSRTQTSMEKIPLLKPIVSIPRQPILRSREVTNRQMDAQSIGERLWSRYKPPRFKPKLNSRPARTKPLEHYFKAPGSRERTPKGAERHKRRRLMELRNPYADVNSPEAFPGGQGFALTDEMSFSSEEIDLEEEREFGPPPGGRTVAVGGGNLEQDLRGYIPDGFIRPDDELVYTTSASDEEIEQDLQTFQTQRLVQPSSTGESPGAEKEVVEATSAEKQSRRGKMDALEKELLELQPFYYDKQREKYKPGKLFATDEENLVHEEEGVVLRSGRCVGPENFSDDFVSRDLSSQNNLPANNLTDVNQPGVSSSANQTLVEEIPRRKSPTQALLGPSVEWLSLEELICRDYSADRAQSVESSPRRSSMLDPELDRRVVGSAPPRSAAQGQWRNSSNRMRGFDSAFDRSSPSDNEGSRHRQQTTQPTMQESSAGNVQSERTSNQSTALSREARSLQVWAWDHNYERFPPNDKKYTASDRKRRRRPRRV